MHTGDEIRREVTEFDRWRYGGIISPRLLGCAMAKRKYSGKRNKIEPSAQTLTFQMQVPPGANEDFTLDQAKLHLWSIADSTDKELIGL